MFPHTLSNTTDTFTPSEIAFLYVFRSLWSNLKNLSKCLKSRIFTYRSDVVQLLSPHAMSVQFRCITHDLFVKSWFENDATVPYRTCKIKHDAPLCTCHSKRLDLFLRYSSNWPVCDLCSALFLWYRILSYYPWYCTIDFLFLKVNVKSCAYP